MTMKFLKISNLEINVENVLFLNETSDTIYIHFVDGTSQQTSDPAIIKKLKEIVENNRA